MLVKDIIKILQCTKQTVATAESCTGGWVAKKITDVEGASTVFKYGIISYSDEAKMKLLGVKEETLKEHTAVSPEVAREMAEGVRMLSDSDIGVSITGYADGIGPKEGKVYIGISNKKGYEKVIFKEYHGKDREGVRYHASDLALDLIVEAALKDSSFLEDEKSQEAPDYISGDAEKDDEYVKSIVYW